jgi:hypothetical protein
MLTTWFLSSLLFSCTNSGLGVVQTADTGPISVGCPFEGEWELTVVECSSFPYNDKWDATYDDVTMEIEQDGEACKVDFRWSSATCTEEEQWTITPTVPEFTEDQDPKLWEYDGKATVSYEGISDCDPGSCEFEQSEMSFTSEPCDEGDRKLSASIEVDMEIDDQLTIEGLLDDPGRHDCVLGLRTTWVRK